jgi:hypothetical protein
VCGVISDLLLPCSAKNFAVGKEGASTKVATAVLELQRALPQARVVYCSATGVSEVGHMAYLERMGLWGPGSAFPGVLQDIA